MKVSVMFQKKVSGSEPYSSEGYHVVLETEPPPEVAGDREKLASYLMALAAEANARVEEALSIGRVEQQEREPVEVAPPAVRTPRGSPNGNGHRRPPTNGRAAPRVAVRPRANGNGHANGEGASIKQVNFIRSLAADAGYSNTQLEYLAEEVLGQRKSLSSLTKQEASALIETLRGGQQ